MNTWLSLAVMIIVIYSVRMLPVILLRHPIQSPFIRSFLTYVPYVTLAVMTFPAIIQATDNMISGIAALITGIVIAWIFEDLFIVAACCCVAVFVTGLFL